MYVRLLTINLVMICVSLISFGIGMAIHMMYVNNEREQLLVELNKAEAKSKKEVEKSKEEFEKKEKEYEESMKTATKVMEAACVIDLQRQKEKYAEICKELLVKQVEKDIKECKEVITEIEMHRRQRRPATFY